MKTSEKIKQIRTKLGITQFVLSEKLRISRGYLSDLETGHKKPSKLLENRINRLFRHHCVKKIFKKKEPLVEVLTPEKSKQSWFIRFIKWFME